MPSLRRRTSVPIVRSSEPAPADAVPSAESAPEIATEPTPVSLADQVAASRLATEEQKASALPETEAQPDQFTPAERSLNVDHPSVMSDPAYARLATAAVATLAQQGIRRGSADYEQRLQPQFESLLNEVRAQAAPPPMAKTTPLSLAEKAPSMTGDEPDRRSFVHAAPVSREVASSITGRIESNSRVTLSPLEREMAKASGITEVEYARHKLKLQGLKAGGHYQEEG